MIYKILCYFNLLSKADNEKSVESTYLYPGFHAYRIYTSFHAALHGIHSLTLDSITQRWVKNVEMGVQE